MYIDDFGKETEDKPTLFISFSGGATSAYMTDLLIANYSHKYTFVILFANTGQEHPKTLEFIRRCDERWGGVVIWLEAVVNPEKGKGTRHRVVSFETCTRIEDTSDSAPFVQVVKKYGLPGPGTPQICTRELKGAVMSSYRRTFEAEYKIKCFNAIGIRNDETHRVMDEAKKKKFRVVYPLVDWFSSSKQDFRILEKEHADTNNQPGYAPRRFFRGNRTVDDMFALADIIPIENISSIDDSDELNECGESCDANTPETLGLTD